MKKKLVAMGLAVISACSLAFGGCGKMPDAPDYSDSNLQYDFYGYSACIDGWNIDGVAYDTDEDYLSLERIREYKDAGMTIYFPQAGALVTDSEMQDFANSNAKKALDYSLEAGIDKVILMDTRIQALSKPSFGTDKQIREKVQNGTILDEAGLIGEGKQFATEDDLDAYIAECMAPYKDHEAFYGVMLGDEPYFYHAENYGQVYRSIKRVCPKAYIQYNLHPISSMEEEDNRKIYFTGMAPEEGLTQNEKMVQAYEQYLGRFLNATGAGYIQYDQYPFRRADSVDLYYILGLQVASKLAQEYGVEVYFVTQTYGQTDNVANPRMLSQADLYWLNNMLVGFGIKQISYFTYFTKADNNREHFIDGNSFLTWKGEKTGIYHWMKQIMAEEQKLAPTILNFEYRSSKVYRLEMTNFDCTYAMRTIETPSFVALKNVNINKEVALVTELYDDDKQNYMYMVQNIIDSTKKGSKAYQTTVLTFDKAYKYAAVYVKGERTLVKLDKGTLTLKQKPGEATYVMPY